VEKPSATPVSDNSKSKRIASNTLVLFIRMLVITVVNLFSVRWVLNGLGVVDYGVFNAIAGVVTTSTCLSSVLAISTQRFYSYAMGQGNTIQLRDIFSVSLLLAVGLAIFIILIFSCIGPWLIATKMTIPVERLEAAQWVFGFALLSFVFSVIQIPFMGAIFAHEDMGIYALITTVDCLLKLGAAYMIGKATIDNLVFYGSALSVIALLVMLSYIGFAIKKYTECHYRRVRGRRLFKELLSFSGWTFYGTMAGVGTTQGSIILLNIFFGPVINAAFSIGNQIYNALNTLNNSTVLAFRPAMIKAYSGESFSYLNRLFSFSNKMTLYLLACVSVPFILEAKTILNFWLGKEIVSDEMVLFCQLYIVYTVCLALQNPITIIMQATGHIRNYSIYVESLMILCVPINYLLFKMGMGATYTFGSMIGVCLVAHIVRLFFLKHYYSYFSFRPYLLSFIAPAIVIIAISSCVGIWLHKCMDRDLLRFVMVSILSASTILVMAYFIGITKEERQKAKDFILQLLRRR
jgi:O-antigen/teichoic acid export membrane protein